jgi:hypothetical protein
MVKAEFDRRDRSKGRVVGAPRMSEDGPIDLDQQTTQPMKTNGSPESAAIQACGATGALIAAAHLWRSIASSFHAQRSHIRSRRWISTARPGWPVSR